MREDSRRARLLVVSLDQRAIAPFCDAIENPHLHVTEWQHRSFANEVLYTFDLDDDRHGGGTALDPSHRWHGIMSDSWHPSQYIQITDLSGATEAYIDVATLALGEFRAEACTTGNSIGSFR